MVTPSTRRQRGSRGLRVWWRPCLVVVTGLAVRNRRPTLPLFDLGRFACRDLARPANRPRFRAQQQSPEVSTVPRMESVMRIGIRCFILFFLYGQSLIAPGEALLSFTPVLNESSWIWAWPSP